MSTNNLSEKIDALLPQTQCEECGFKGCKPYADAIANGEAQIDLCAPGGVSTLEAVATLLQVDPTPFRQTVTNNYRPASVAIIDEELCIGCVKCINVCPVDAIVGAAKMMHTVIKDECTGCELCIPACPMDCIQLQPIAERSEEEQQAKATQWRERYTSRADRLTHRSSTQFKKETSSRADKKAAIAAALARKKKG